MITAQANPVTFSFTGEGSGNLDGTVFTNAAFEVLIWGDTYNIEVTPSFHSISDLSGTIDISGLGVGSFVNPLYVFNNQENQVVGFGNSIQLDLIDLFISNVGLDTYDLTTSFGPITDPTPYFRQFNSVELDTGFLTFSSMSYATFTATVIPASTHLAMLPVME
jgi:hypothetical protein